MGRNQELIETFIEVEELDTDQFLKVKETLTRIGLAGRAASESERPLLWQSCHILHKQGRYYICHFKQLFQLDGRTKVTSFDEQDQDRTRFIANLLADWGLVKLVNPTPKPRVNIVIIPFAKKGEWDLRSKYTIGEKHSKPEGNR